MNKKYLLTLLLLLTAIVTNAQMTMHDLRCENLVNPLGIDNLYPHFSWKLTSPINGDQQTAYQLQIATTAEALASGNANVWDSGKAYVKMSSDFKNDFIKINLSDVDAQAWENSSVNTITESETAIEANRYNLQGQRVRDNYNGVTILKGKKYIKK